MDSGLLLFFMSIITYPLLLTIIITFIYRRNELNWCDVFSFVCLSIFLSYLSPALYILLMANIRFGYCN